VGRKAINAAMLRSEIMGDEINEDDPDAPIPAEQPDPEPIPVRAEAPAPVAAAPAIALTGDQLQSILAAVMAQASSGNAALAEAVQESVARARQKIPENEVHSGASTLNPQGGPKPAVRMPVWHGMIDPSDQKVHPLVPIAGSGNLENMCSVAEIEALNTIRATDGLVDYELTDGTAVKVRVIEQVDGAGEPWRLVVCWPTGFFTNKELRNRIGRIPQMVRQLTAAAPAAA